MIVDALHAVGAARSIVIDEAGTVLAGNATIEAAAEAGITRVRKVVADGNEVIAVQRLGLTPDQKRDLALYDNRTAELASWDVAQLAADLDEGVDLSGQFTEEELAAVLASVETETPAVVSEVTPAVRATTIERGQVFALGQHRLMCGDSTSAEDVARLMDGAVADLVHADPPYGMGKEKDGIANDNLHAEKLDAFQLRWWRALRSSVADNASVYIWGRAPDLWRLWYVGGLGDSERMTFRNELVWAKGSAGAGGISHMGAEGLREYPTETERCLFFMLGEQAWARERRYRRQEVKAGRLTEDSRGRSYADLRDEFYETRAYFDNTHENMTDVWGFDRVSGEERFGHATPKPVAMAVRIVRTSTKAGGIVVEPFAGSGSTLMAAEEAGRKCYAMEIDPGYCQVVIDRWEAHTEQQAEKLP